MSEDTLRYVVENWNSITVSLLVFLLAVGFLWLFYTDRIISPKSITELRTAKAALEEKCSSIDRLLDAAGNELTDAKINYAKAAERIVWLEETIKRLQAELEELRQRMARWEMEAEVKHRWTPPKRDDPS